MSIFKNILGNKVVKNIQWIVIAKVMQAIINLVITMITARYLGPSNYGVINYAASLVAFAAPITQLGLNAVIVQKIVLKPEKESSIIGTSLFLCTISSFFCICGVTCFAAIANFGETETIVVCLLYSLSLFFQALEIIQYWFQAKLISKYFSIVSLIAYAIIAVYKIYLLVTNKGVYWFAISQALDYAIIAIVLLFIYKNKTKQKLSFDFTIAKELMQLGKYFIISGMMSTVTAQTDKVMLKIMLNSTETGLYSAAATCAGMTGFVFIAIIDSFRPTIFASAKENDENFKNKMQLLYLLVFYLAIAQSLFVSLFAKYIINILYGSAYINSVNALKIIVWYTAFSYIGPIKDIWLMARNKTKYVLIINGFGALLNVVLNYFLIPTWGIEGAAIATLITQILENFILGFFIPDIRENSMLILRALSCKVLKSYIKRYIS